MQIHSLAFTLLVGSSLAACAGDEAVDLDLSQHGVASVVRDGDGYALRDGDAQIIGRVVAQDGELRASLHGSDASLTWDASTGTAGCNGQSFVIARGDAKGWALVRPEGASLAACGDSLNIAETLAARDGITLPWRDHLIVSEQQFEVPLDLGTCVSTWVMGSSCSSCYNAACQADRGDRPCAQSGSASCDSGTVYTTCNICFQT
jgi:hypothetical protein